MRAGPESRYPGHAPGPPIPTLLHLGHAPLSTLRDLRGRSAAIRRGDAVRLRVPGSVALLLAEPAPYLRAAVEAGAALLDLRLAVYGPEDVQRLGDPLVAGARLGALHPALLVSGLAATIVAAIAEKSPAPVVEAGGPGGDPAGAIADLDVLERAMGGLEGRKLAWIGESCGLLHDILVAGCTHGLSVAVAHPVGHAPDLERVTWARERAAVTGASVLVTTEVNEALADAHAIYAEPWPESAGERFRGYAVQRHSVRMARGGAFVLHRAPERRGAELSQSLTEEPGWLALEQSRARADAWAAVLWALTQPDPLRSVLRW